ncbi:hypothetical protein BN874_2460002 [Candidatus Contendobacter odensis Run_B_J11]|uniref:Uncharacterized protein n=1 Tax=Candidatus Contendobacter odensis Run_B_J11 TaxID=1400861 RepID=A0A7U7J3S1_9GAMM|nr:hypothetical protein BN874_2460002 [Candidatus Contendobacter odensis Run_B_J11]
MQPHLVQDLKEQIFMELYLVRKNLQYLNLILQS